ncbi:MAG: NADP-dependent malic enzyme [Chloroherpetonaceae bacterium]|nr:NADP-dependent malic enzyme [bacterium]
MKIRDEDALNYHSTGRKGKIEVITTKPCETQWDLSLAYTPGVAVPCLVIEKDPMKAFEYTAKGNLVAVISNGTAVLGLGNIGAIAGKPVMEGKGVLFKRFADIDVFDIEVNSNDQEEMVRIVEALSPTFGGINLEDIKAPECFYIENELKKRLDIPVFHDDQHGTAIISGAALLNASEIIGKKLSDLKIVYNGAGASGIACAKFHISLGVNPENVIMCDTKGVIYKGRTEGMNPFKEEFARDTSARTLEEALVGADVFFGLSGPNVVSKDMVRSMAANPIILAMANPDPEITYEDALDARKDVIMATGRSDYPNQVNNVLGFPFIFRGALDVRATAINEEMKKAASHALAALAKEDVPESVKMAYGGVQLKFGREYIIPKPFDPRVLTWVAPAVAKAAMETGVARIPIEDFDVYRTQLDIRMGRTLSIMSTITRKATISEHKSIVYPEGNNVRIIKAAQLALDQGIAKPILLGKIDEIKKIAFENSIAIDGISIVNPNEYEKIDEYVEDFYQLRQRKGITKDTAYNTIISSPNHFGAMMVRKGDACSMVSGLGYHYPETIRPALQIIGKDPSYEVVSGLYIVSTKNKVYFLADTTVNLNPTANQIADITLQAADFVKYFDIDPMVALLSYSNYGSAKGDSPEKMQKALQIIKQRSPNLVVDGEMQADTAVNTMILDGTYPFSPLKETGANVLIFPDLDSGNISYKLLHSVGGARIVGPILLGLTKSVHILQREDDVNDILNMTAIAAVDAIKKAGK